jgi:hypothetical protein
MCHKPEPIVRINKTHVVVLCPIGHLIEAHKLDSNFGGSALEAELGAYQTGHETRWHRLAAKCDGHGH